MRFLHTADLHLGRQFNGLSLEEDQSAVLEQIVAALKSHAVDVLVIAGDIFDRAAPPAPAVRQFNTFLSRVATETRACVVMIAGNHDSGDRIAMMSIMTDTTRALIRGVPSPDERPLILHDKTGPVAFTALPFAYEYQARECFTDETIETPEDVLRRQVEAARPHIPTGARWVIVAHAFVAGASPSDGERSLTRVGGIETVGTDVFHGAHYVALGHLHRPQSVGADHVRYSGAPLAFGFDEAGTVKSMTLVELDAAGGISIDTIPFQPLRGVRVLTDRHAALCQATPSDDLIKIVLTDDVPIIDAMKRIREVFPNACELTYARDSRAPEVKSGHRPSAGITDPVTLVCDFVSLVRPEPPTDPERQVVADAFDALRTQGDAA